MARLSLTGVNGNKTPVHLEVKRISSVELFFSIQESATLNGKEMAVAKKRRGNRTAQVREYLEQHPGQSVSEAHSGLAEQGINVSRSLVAQVKTKMGQTQPSGPTKRPGRKKKASGRRAASAATTSANQVITADDLYEAKRLADELGGIQRLRDALDALEGLQ